MAMTRLEKKAKDERRRRRAGATELEDRLWTALRRINVDGHRFSRQCVIGPYLADFVCQRLGLVVEIDGAQHGFAENRERDARRDAWLAGQGYRVLRFWNAEVRADIDSVLDTIFAVVEERRHMPDGARARQETPLASTGAQPVG